MTVFVIVDAPLARGTDPVPPPDPMRRRVRSVAGLVLEGDAEPNSGVDELPVLDRHVLAQALGHAQVSDALRRRLDGVARGRCPRLAADADDLGDAIHAICHGMPPRRGMKRAGCDSIAAYRPTR